jgi:hypothetical protein
VTTHIHIMQRLNVWIYNFIPSIHLHGVVLNYAMDTSSLRGVYLSTGSTLLLSFFFNWLLQSLSDLGLP